MPVRAQIIDTKTNRVIAEQGFACRDEAESWTKAEAWARSDKSEVTRRNIDECWDMTEQLSITLDVSLSGPAAVGIRVFAD
ncbi:hypothetical protein [Rhodococcus sp. Q]|uniref:hypothetical protein n=1 Tax=Rhodococcus sp. Q TaxID=2502252 RepID=UPI0010F90E07|nr:hypothetical protein [Rhodococcus sp. Q]